MEKKGRLEGRSEKNCWASSIGTVAAIKAMHTGTGH
jgi:hypothetical protein